MCVYLLRNEGFTQEIKIGFLWALLSSSRPINELLFPNLKEQRVTMQNQFVGMTEEDFNYQDFENTRKALIAATHESLTEKDRTFLIDFEKANPDWTLYDFGKYPAIQWKLQNLKTFKINNPDKYHRGIQLLKENLA